MTDIITENHELTLPTIGSETGDDLENWGEELNDNLGIIEDSLVIRDTFANQSTYTPTANTLYYATDTEKWFLGDGSTFNSILSTGVAPTFKDVTAESVDSNTLTANTGTIEDTPSGATDEQISTFDVGGNKTYSFSNDPVWNVLDVDLNTDGRTRGVRTIMTQQGTDNPSFGFFSRLTADGTGHNQIIPFYGRVLQKDSTENGQLPPSAGLYLDSKGSTVRPFAAVVDDGASVWENGIVLNGDYSNHAIRTPGWTLRENGNTVRDGGINTAHTTVTDSYTVSTTDEIVGIDTATAGGFAVTLVTPSAGKRYTFTDEVGNCGTNTCTIRTDGTELIDGQTDYVLDTNWESVTVYGDGDHWHVI